MLFLSACGTPVPQAITETSTPLPPSLPPNTSAPTSTSAPEPAVPVTSLEEIVGTWLTFCGSRQCAFEIHADSTYRSRYVSNDSVIERGALTLTGGVLQLVAASGACVGMPDGLYQASLIRLDGKPYILQLESDPKDGCADRYDALSRDLKYSAE
jgi:hypothetical protein